MRSSMGAYLVVELPGMRTPGIDFTARHPGCVIDVALAPAPPAAATEPVMECVMLVRNAGPALAELHHGLQTAYGTVRTFEHDMSGNVWMGGFTLPVPAVPDVAARKVLGFFLEHGLDMWWVRLEDGQAYLRAQVPEGQSVQALADKLTGFLEALKVDGAVGIETGSPAELQPWRDMVRRIRQHAR